MKKIFIFLAITTLSAKLNFVNAQACSAGTITAVRDTICEGTPGNLTVSGSSGAIQWQSSITNGNFTSIPGATSTTYRTNPLIQTIYFRVFVSNGACSDTSASFKLYIPPALVANFSYTSAGSKVNFNSSGSSGNIQTYQWDFGDGTTSYGPNPVHTYLKDTTYYACLTLYDGSNCSYTFCRYVTTCPSTNVTITGSLTMCKGIPTNLTAGGYSTYKWSPSTGLNTTNGAYVTANPSSSTTYTIIGTSSIGCTASTSAAVIVNSLPPVPTVTAGGSTTFCQSNSVVLSGNYIPGLSYEWNRDGSSVSTGTNDTTYVASDSGAYNLLAITSKDCKSSSSTIYINVEPAPYSYVSGTDSFCTGSNVTLSSYSPNGIISYQWQLNESDINGATNQDYTATAGGYYDVVVTNSNGCSGASYGQEETEVPLPPPQSIIGNPSITPFQVSPYAVNPATGITFNWIVEGGAIQSGQGTNSINVLWGATGPYSVSLIQQNEMGCTDTTTLSKTSGVESVEVINGTLFPNPSSEKTTLVLTTAGKYSVRITDISGQVLMTENFTGTTCTFDLHNYTPAIYELTVTDSNNYQQRWKVVKAH